MTPAGVSASSPLVAVEGLTVEFLKDGGVISAVNGVSFEIGAGEVLGVIGESGSGKSVTMRALMRILPSKRSRIRGRISVDGRDVLALGARDLALYRGGVASMIFQEPMLALDPVFTIGTQIAETVTRHMGVSRAKARARALEMLELVRIPSARARLDSYPHEMSGGMRQRAMIALALSCAPKLLLADEPTTALDATVQIQVLLLLRELQKELGMAAIFVTHDVGVAAEISDRVAVMYAGRMVETGAVGDVLRNPRHPYTQGLLASTVHGSMRGSRVAASPGAPPDLARLPPGCAFAPRCPRAADVCRTSVPPLILDEALGRAAACVRLDSGAVATTARVSGHPS
jgi:peptide/nickel transport system ATP-binding protein